MNAIQIKKTNDLFENESPYNLSKMEEKIRGDLMFGTNGKRWTKNRTMMRKAARKTKLQMRKFRW